MKTGSEGKAIQNKLNISNNIIFIFHEFVFFVCLVFFALLNISIFLITLIILVFFKLIFFIHVQKKKKRKENEI